MMDTEALDILRAQGYAAGTPDARTGRVRVWTRDSEEAIDIQIGRELNELAEGKLSFDEIRLRRDDEVVIEPD
ncbi:MAG TPA: hypothetical protein VKU19_20525 [Bryobacteraceae bacterium]|nr:hypothetical protein [Bryobacteraceae bacterium]